MRFLTTVLLTACAAGCAFKPAKIFSSYTNLEVREAGRSLHCRAGSANTAAYLFPDAAGVEAWQTPRGLNLIANDAPRYADGVIENTSRPPALAHGAAPYAVIELGDRPTGGYGLAVSRTAVLRGELLILSATFVSPGPDSFVTQALTSPCVLVRLPPGRYSTIEVQDQSGAVRATGKIISANVTP